MAQSTRLLFVCTGNICRSPLAVCVLRSRLGHATWLTLESAGTHALTARPMTVESVWLAHAQGVGLFNPEEHSSRPVTASLVQDVDLVLTMTRDQRRDIVGLVPHKLRRTFTVRQFAALIEGLDAGRLATVRSAETPKARWDRLLEVIQEARLLMAPPKEEDVLDPYGKYEGAYQQCASQLMPALAVIERGLRLIDTGVEPTEDLTTR